MTRYKTIISELRIAGIVGTLFIVSMTSGWTDNLGIASMPCGNTAASDGLVTSRVHGSTQAEANLLQAGSISGNTYTNVFFEMTYEFPKGWTVDRAAMDSDNAPRKKPSRPANPNDGGLYDWAVNIEIYNLLEVSQTASESPRVERPKIRLHATKLLASERTETTDEIIGAFEENLSKNPHVQIIRQPTQVSYAGHTFSEMSAKWIGSTEAYTGYAVTTIQGYSLGFEISANSLEQLNGLFHTLNTLRFKS